MTQRFSDPNVLLENRWSALARRAEAFVWANVGEPLSLIAIAQAAGCTTRRLQYTFHRIHGVGPSTYFKLRRLEAVRDALLAGCTGKTIMDVAAEFGFWHQGHFGADYRRRFGETPSQTLRHGSAKKPAMTPALTLKSLWSTATEPVGQFESV